MERYGYSISTDSGGDHWFDSIDDMGEAIASADESSGGSCSYFASDDDGDTIRALDANELAELESVATYWMERNL